MAFRRILHGVKEEAEKLGELAYEEIVEPIFRKGKRAVDTVIDELEDDYRRVKRIAEYIDPYEYDEKAQEQLGVALRRGLPLEDQQHPDEPKKKRPRFGDHPGDPPPLEPVEAKWNVRPLGSRAMRALWPRSIEAVGRTIVSTGLTFSAMAYFCYYSIRINHPGHLVSGGFYTHMPPQFVELATKYARCQLLNFSVRTWAHKYHSTYIYDYESARLVAIRRPPKVLEMGDPIVEGMSTKYAAPTEASRLLVKIAQNPDTYDHLFFDHHRQPTAPTYQLAPDIQVRCLKSFGDFLGREPRSSDGVELTYPGPPFGGSSTNDHYVQIVHSGYDGGRIFGTDFLIEIEQEFSFTDYRSVY